MVRVALSGVGEPPTQVPSPLDNIPENFALYHPHPNPFNPTTTISFDLPIASYVNLQIFDIHGRSVGAQRAAPEKWMGPGHHQITFDGSDLPSSVYIYHLTAGEYTASGKMVLMK